MNDKPFFDTNVILYAFRQDDRRGAVAESLLAAGGTVSVQVLNEFVAVARRRLDKSWDEIRRALDILRIFCPEPAPLTLETHERAIRIAERYGSSIFDSLIIASALYTGASTLYSEDMRDRHAIEGLIIRNPFAR
jgi:predicted nucleic acid-binding protein